jgi:hypothetical protein
MRTGIIMRVFESIYTAAMIGLLVVIVFVAIKDIFIGIVYVDGPYSLCRQDLDEKKVPHTHSFDRP